MGDFFYPMIIGGTMKIAQSNVNLVSSHQYYEENTVTIQSGVVDRGAFLEHLQRQESIEAEEKDKEKDKHINGFILITEFSDK